MSSRSLASARAKRAAETAPPVSGNRPVTSIGSQAAFSQALPPGTNYRMPPPPNNVRVAKSAVPPSQAPYRQPSGPPNKYKNASNAPNGSYGNGPDYAHNGGQVGENGLPFSKLSVSDAIGLITLRLGRVEQWIIDTDHEREIMEERGQMKTSASSADGVSIPDNHKLIDNSVLSTMISRLDGLEKLTAKTSPNSVSSEEVTQIKDELTALKSQLEQMNTHAARQSLDVAKHTEQLFKLNRELVETKDLLKQFMIKYDLFANEVTQNFSDYEYAIGELEKKIDMSNPDVNGGNGSDDLVATEVADTAEAVEPDLNMDLKTLVKQALEED